MTMMIILREETQTDTSTIGHSGAGSNDYKWVLQIPQITETEAPPLDVFKSHVQDTPSLVSITPLQKIMIVYPRPHRHNNVWSEDHQPTYNIGFWMLLRKKET